MDGGLERLVRILHDFCMCPPPPENPALLYGLQPPNTQPGKPVPTLNPKSFDKHAAYRFSLAFQCVVNIGVRGSEPIRSRVVQAGTLEVVGCILEAWLANKGFAVGPGASASGMPRETREQRLARRQAQNEARQRDQALQLQRALQRQLAADRSRAEDVSAVIQEVRHNDLFILYCTCACSLHLTLRRSQWRSNRRPRNDLDQDHATPIHQLRHRPTQLQLVPTRQRGPSWSPAEIVVERSLRDRFGTPLPPQQQVLAIIIAGPIGLQQD